MIPFKNRSIFLDADFLSSFLRTESKKIMLTELGFNELHVPHIVASELKNGRYIDNSLINEYNIMKANGDIIEDPEIDVESEEFIFMVKLTTLGMNDLPSFGDGEAEALSLAYKYNGCIASNNLKHVKAACKMFGITNITTADILYYSYKSCNKTEEELNDVWKKIQLIQKMPEDSFSDYLKWRGRNG